MPRLGVNIDHVATLRQARRGEIPNPVWAAAAAEQAGCDGIVCHLREDRRHIQERDLWALKKVLRTPLNLEMAAAAAIVKIALKVKPNQATLVPERRQELTTEGGLDLRKNRAGLQQASHALQKKGIRVSLFIDPDPSQIDLAVRLGVPMVEFHTGRYAGARTKAEAARALNNLKQAVQQAISAGLIVAAGHGLDYENAAAVAAIPGMEELNIGFAIIARAIEVGLHQAVREMAALIAEASSAVPPWEGASL